MKKIIFVMLAIFVTISMYAQDYRIVKDTVIKDKKIKIPHEKKQFKPVDSTMKINLTRIEYSSLIFDGDPKSYNMIDIYTKHKIDSSKWYLTTYGKWTMTSAKRILRKTYNNNTEVLIGFGYAPVKNVMIVANGGLEMDSSKMYLRYGLTVFVESQNKRFTGFIHYEYGQSENDWFDLQAKYKTKYAEFGIMARKYYGAGPRIDINIPKVGVNMWLAGLYNQGDFLGGPKDPTMGLAFGLFTRF